MHSNKALIPNLAMIQQSGLVGRSMAVMFGVGFLALFAQLSVYLPWTPVPITGQTFAVALIAATYGRALAPLTVGSYLLAGYLGFPVFANLQSGLSFGPTSGYLLGMFVSSVVISHLVDLGGLKSVVRSYLTIAIGSVITFICGLVVLSLFVPSESLLALGFYPFIVGDIIKTGLASSIAFALRNKPMSKIE